MGKSVNPMWGSFQTQGDADFGFAPGLIVSMSLQPAIPRRVALQQSSPPLRRMDSMYHPRGKSVNHHPAPFLASVSTNRRPPPGAMPLVINQRVPGTRKRSSGFFNPQTKLKPFTGAHDPCGASDVAEGGR